MKIAAAQIRPKWLDKPGTVRKIIDTISLAATQHIELVAFPEAFLSGYPFWLCRTDGASFDNPRQRSAYGQFLEAATEADSAEIRTIVEAARDYRVSAYLGV